MSIFLDDLKPLTIYRKPFIIPINDDDRRKGSCIFLMTPNYQSSINTMKSPLVINRKKFESYYLEKNINFIITQERSLLPMASDNEILNEACYSDFIDIIYLSDTPVENENMIDIDNTYDDIIVAIKNKFMNSKVDSRDLYLYTLAPDKKHMQYTGKLRATRDYYEDGKEQYDYHMIDDEFKSTPCLFKESDSPREALINTVVSSLADENIKSHISKNGEWGSDRFIKGDKSLCLGSFKKEDYDKAYSIAKKAVGNKASVSKDDHFTIFINMKESSSVMTEAAMSAKERNDLPDEAFGIPSQRKYPLNDEDHVRSAIQMFNHVDEKHEKELALNIKHAITKLDIDVTIGKHNRLSKYITTPIQEFIMIPTKEEVIMGEDFIETSNFVSYMDYYNEDKVYDKNLRKILYTERIKNNKEIFQIYDKVKEDCPFIKRTNIKLDLYKNFNLFIDWSYYTESFFKNNYFVRDKGLDLFFDFLNRFIEDKRLKKYTKKTIFIPVKDWQPTDGSLIWDYTKTINPISLIYRSIKLRSERLQQHWGNYDIVLLGTNSYCKLDINNLDKNSLNKFLTCVKKIIKNDPVVDPIDTTSQKGIVTDVLDKIEDSQGITINSLTGATSKISEKELQDKVDAADIKASDAAAESKAKKEKELVDTVTKAAQNAVDADEVIANLDNNDEDSQFVKQLLQDLAEDEDNKVKMNATRASRMMQIDSNLQSKKFKDSSVKDILESKPKETIKATSLPVDSIDESWKNMKFMNFDKEYNLDDDIVKCIYSLSKKDVPIGILDIAVEDTSTTEDFKETYTVSCEDSYGQRFKLVFDIPRLKDSRFMKVGGNEKIISGQLMLLPIIKTDNDTVQIVSNYNKIFVRRFGSTTGKSFVITDRILKTLRKLDDKSIKVYYGDNTKISEKYELPIDYIDFGTEISKIEIRPVKGDTYDIYFNQDEFSDKYKIDDSKGLGSIILNPGTSKEIVLYYNVTIAPTFSDLVKSILSVSCPKFDEIYKTTNTSVRYTYSKASVLASNIPVVVICGYNIGLTNTLKKANIKYELSEKRILKDKDAQDEIKFADGYLTYDLNYFSSLLMNGLKECNTEDFSLKEINSKRMWVSFLDIFGGRILADGLDNFYDLMMDPLTVRICEKYDLPSDYIEALIYSNNLLADNKYNRHVDITGNRYRTNEIIAGYFYKAIAKSYSDYRNANKHGKKTPMTIKRSAVIDGLMIDPTESDASTIQPLLELESRNAVSFKGLSGMNSDRSYSLDKRTFDKTMINNIAMSTGFAGNVGVTRQMTLDANIEDGYGSIKTTENEEGMGVTKSLCMTEALTPFGTTRDDPFRTAMTFIQTAKHEMRVHEADPLLVTSGADEALPYMTSDTFAFKAKESGTIKTKTDDYMVIEYDKPIDSFGKTSEVVDLRELTKKNSDGGFYVTVKLDTSLKEGQKIKKQQIVAYDKTSYNPEVGPEDNIAFNIGTLAKVAILNTDEGYEDSAIISEKLAKKMSSDVVVQKTVLLPKDTNIYNIVKKGQSIQEGEPLLIFQNAFSDEDANALLRNITDDGDGLVSELGRIPVKSKITGTVQDIKIYRTVEKTELSPSLKSLCNKYDSDIKTMKKVMEQYDKDAVHDLDADYALPTTGKLKKANDMVLIEFYLRYTDKMAIGDKLVYYSAVKGVVKDIFPEDEEPYSDYRPKETVDTLLSVGSVNARMVGSILTVGSINKIVIELARQCKDIMGIKYDENL